MNAHFKGLCTVVCALGLLVPALASPTPSITIHPGYSSVGVNGTIQYSATVVGKSNTSVTWDVNGFVGGNATVGTISPSGLYTAPAKVPSFGVLITAHAGSRLLTSAYVGVSAAGPSISSVNPSPIPVGNYYAVVRGSGFQPGAVVLGGSVQLATVYLDSSRLGVSGYQPTAGTGLFQVKNPGTLWGAAFTATFATSKTITPATSTLILGQSMQFRADNTIKWAATAGTISDTGYYTAPATMPSSSIVSVTATNSTGSSTATVTLAASQSVMPSNPSLTLSQTQQFSCTGALFWTATAGTMTASGLYTAPSSMTPSSTVKVTAYWIGGTATTSVGFKQATSQTITPTAVAVATGKTYQFLSAGATKWTTSVGTISASGLYSAPASLPPNAAAGVTATGPGGQATAAVALFSSAPQTISPTTASLTAGSTQQFTSTGATGWTAIYGSISSMGLYTAPANLPPTAADTVMASGANGMATATVALTVSTLVITGMGVGGQLPLGSFSTTITGTGFTSASVASLNGSPLTTAYSGGSLSVSGFAAQSGSQNLVVSNGSSVSAPFSVQVGIANALASAAAARRFLEQAAFGPTPSDANHVQTVGLKSYLNEQLAMAPVSNYSGITGSQGGMPQHFLTMAVNNPDQLRQRVAFALSQIWVVSFNKLIWDPVMVNYQNTILNDALVNYRQLMQDVTLTPAMGQFLDMANNGQANPAIGSLANENYARELMQLFSIGTVMMNQDGTTQMDSNGMPIPTYTQFTIGQFARVFTGWTYSPKTSGQSTSWNAFQNNYGPLVPYPAQHDSGSKHLLSGYVTPAGLSPLDDLNAALDNVFNHPNVGPFVARQMIQKLVKSNPSPAYISRVAGAFNDNGNGVRGDMKAVVTAVLLDQEARANDNGGNDQSTDGHLQEPALFIAGMVRAFGGAMNDQNYYAQEASKMGQDLFNPVSVFNYYSPDYTLPGTSAGGGEFEIHTPNNAIVRANEVSTLFSQYSNPVMTYGPGTSVDLSPYLSLASNPSTLVNALDLTLTHGTMPASMKSTIVTAVAGDTVGALHQVETACYLMLTSSYYNVWH